MVRVWLNAEEVSFGYERKDYFIACKACPGLGVFPTSRC